MTYPKQLIGTGATLALVALLLITAVPTPAAAQEADVAMRVYETRFLSRQAGIMLAVQVCGDDQDRCQVEAFGNEGFTLRAQAAVHAEVEALLNERDVPPATQEFRVILLAASRDGEQPDLPDDVREAVQDLRSVLAYTGFRLIDSGWLRTSEYASTSLGEMGSFEAQLNFQGDPRRDGRLLVELDISHRPVIEREMPEGYTGTPPSFLGDVRRLLTSQFGIEVGETVVVGTSRVNGGDEAIVVLLTALDR